MINLLYIGIGFGILVAPIVLTLANIINLFKKKKIKENMIDILTFVLGIGLSGLLYLVSDFKDYTEALRLGGFEVDKHAPIASWSMPTVIAIFIFGFVSYFLIRKRKLNLPPLIIVCSISGIIVCSIYMIIFIIQITNTELFPRYLFYGIPYLALFPISYILCSIRAIIEVVRRYKEKNLKAKEFDNKFLNKCSQIIYNTDNWPILAVVLTVPLTAILICILVLFGQRPDEAIRAFLETSDWNLSQKVSPPSVEYDAHYLCTVAVSGHKKIVKPTRVGIRRGQKIIVNRQLCVANAFEDLIQEKTPRFHHFVRYIYDKYGFPLAKCIKTAWEADITYILMKPLEWIFLIVLYSCDSNPENRISTQYIGKKIKNVI